MRRLRRRITSLIVASAILLVIRQTLLTGTLTFSPNFSTKQVTNAYTENSQSSTPETVPQVLSSRNKHNDSDRSLDSGALSDQIFPDLFRLDFDETNDNYTEFWSKIRDLAGDDCLYPRSYDVSQVNAVLRKGKIIYADLFKKQTSLKLKLEYEGNQSAIFKVKLVERMNKSMPCNIGCEHPEYEVTAFTLNRMFDLRNMPYTTGRVLSWPELEPVASPRLKQFIQLQDDYSVCLNWTCLPHKNPQKTYCFENGRIPGAVIYFIEDRQIDFMRSVGKNIYHGYYQGVADKNDIRRVPGDKRFCLQFRKDARYKNDAWFLDLVDIAILDYMMSHRDAKHTYVSERGNNSKPEFNAMIDFGLAFCKTDDVANLAPLTQCCRMRSRLFRSMVHYRDTLEETFVTLTEDDPLHPLLLPELMSDMKQKMKQTLALIDFCRNLDGDSRVFIDI